jgi:hypothetical protein
MEWLESNWFWWAFALALFALEALLPGTFMLWLGFAAIATGVLQLALPSLGVGLQWIAFALLSLVAVAIGWRIRARSTPAPTDQPLLNQRARQLVGRVFPLDSAIVDGRGRLKIGDAFWTVEGPDLPGGARVRVDAVDGMTLKVNVAD